MSDQGQPNRLINETSPYLLQHAYNPVDWYPWGAAAFAAARERDLPVFLSIGYSACHWCHVMERESFENPQVAELMNRWYINIKVDREERPDLDQIYMTAVQLITGQGGWPMSVFLTADAEPFFGGTYWPPVSRGGMLGFTTILERLHDYWRNDRQECLAKGGELTQAIDQLHHHEQARSPLQLDLLRHAQHRMIQNADMQEGGFGQAPKFPHPADLRVLLRTWNRFETPEALQVVTITLDKMADGGIYDHLGGGFARYSTDRYWLVPHFEKMLYDNSQLVLAYLEGWQATGNPRYRDVVLETLAYIEREMTAAESGFYSTQDADSEGVEGKFYVWSEAEIDQLLAADAAKRFKHCYQVSREGNWEGHNILHRQESWSHWAASFGMTEQLLVAELQQSREILLAARNHRIWPGRDEKIIVAWNGLMLSAYARAGLVLQQADFLATAEKSASFLLHHLRREDGSLWHCRKDGINRNNGFLDDYACFIEGLCDLAEATQRQAYATAALRLTEKMLELFYDPDAHAFHYTPNDHEPLIVRVRDRYDSAIPSGNNLATQALLRVARLCGEEKYRTIAGECLAAMSGTIRQQPSGMGQALIAVDLYLGDDEQWVIVPGEQTDPNERAISCYLKQQLLAEFQPRRMLLFATPTADDDPLSLVMGKPAVDHQLTLYRCQIGSCQPAIVGIDAINDVAFGEEQI